MFKKIINYFFKIDSIIAITSLLIITLGMIILASASLPYADFYYHAPWYFLIRQSISIIIGLFFAFIMFIISPYWWYKWRHSILFVTVLGLILLLIPGIGHSVKGSIRWIKLYGFNLQLSECAKFCMILYIAGFVKKNYDYFHSDYKVFVRPLAVISSVASLILLEPDFGTVCVLMAVTLVQLFIAGARFRYVAFLLLCVSVVLSLVAFSAPYRVKRLLSFMEPWEHEDAESYQLVHSLMAISSGGWFGIGLGESVEKLFYLPEAHTDFLFAILAEELGFLGIVFLLSLFSILILRIGYFAYLACKKNQVFLGNILVGISSWWSIQMIINLSVNLGLLPTKGITLPFISYGGSSMIVCLSALGLVLRCINELEDKNK